MKDIYRSFYETVGRYYPEDERTYATISGIARKKWILAKLKALGPGTLLDCGCNVGRLSACWNRGAVFGVDVSYAVLARGHVLFPETCFLHGDVRSMSFIRDSVIDNALACEVVEHLDTPSAFFRELYRIMKPKARLLITVPGYTKQTIEHIPLGIMRSYGVTSGTRGDHYLHRTYKPAELTDLVHTAGFTILESGSFETELRFWQKPLTMIETFFYALSARAFPVSRLNQLFQHVMDRTKIDIFMMLDMFGLSSLLQKFVKQGRRCYVLAEK